MSALEWLNDLVQWVIRFVPRWSLVPPTHRGVRFGPFGGASQKGPGLVFWWPIIHQLVRIPVTVQSLQISARSMPLEDESAPKLVPRIAVCGLAVQYRVEDAVKAAVNTLHLHALVDNRCQAALGQHWTTQKAAKEAAAAAKAALSPELLDSYGVVIERLDVTHSGQAIGVLQFGAWCYNDQPLSRNAE